MENEQTDYKPTVMSDASTPLDRLRYLFERFHGSQLKFADRLGIDASAMSKTLSGKMPITDQFCNRVAVNLGVSKDWFKYGKGIPYPKSNGPSDIVLEDALISRAGKGAPVYDIDVTAGVRPLATMFTEDLLRGYVDIPSVTPSNPIVRVSGDSMSPRVPDGAYISIRPIRDTSIIIWGMIYVVQLEEYRLVKIIKPCPGRPDTVILHSVNPMYDDLEVPRASILSLYQVESVINCQFLS